MKRFIAAVVLALMAIPFGSSAWAAARTDKLDCFFYQTFREREITDCL